MRGIDAAIVFIAFIVVASAFSYSALNMGFFTAQKSQEVIYAGVDVSGSSLKIIGEVYGLNTVTDSPEAIDHIRFTVGTAAGGSTVDLQEVTILFMTDSAVNTLVQNETSVHESITLVTPLTLENIPRGQWGVMEISNGEDDALIEPGEQCTILVALPSDDKLGVNEDFTIEIRPFVGASMGIMKRGPPKISTVNIL